MIRYETNRNTVMTKPITKMSYQINEKQVNNRKVKMIISSCVICELIQLI